MTRPNESDTVPTANPADVQEQERPVIDRGFDPETVADDALPDGSQAEADIGDLEEQSLEVAEDDE